MKKLLVFTLLLLNSISFACGFYPYGEDVRMCFLNSSQFNCQSFDGFHFSSSSYFDPVSSNENLIAQPNEKLWFEYCKKTIPIETISDAIYKISEKDFTENSSNKMIQYLIKNKDFEAINYLKFAKSCEVDRKSVV